MGSSQSLQHFFDGVLKGGLHHQVVTVKSKYVVENQTGMALEIKQRGTPDLNVNPTYGGDVRCACRLSHDSR